MEDRISGQEDEITVATKPNKIVDMARIQRW